MTITELLTQFANPEAIHSMSTAEKLNAGLATTVLGMGITFTALVILQFVMSWMDKLLNRRPAITSDSAAGIQEKSQEIPAAESTPKPEHDENELIAAITVALATQLKTSVDNIVIRDIERIDTHAPAWHKAGIIEQMNSRL